MSMPLFGAIEEFSKPVDERYNFMNRRCILNMRTIRTRVLHRVLHNRAEGVTGDGSAKSNFLTPRLFSRML